MHHQALGRRNFVFLTLEGTLLFFGLTFLNPNSVIPVFIDAYSGALQLAGLASTIRMLFMLLPKLIIGPFIPGVQDLSVFIRRMMLITRPLFLFMLPVLFLVTDSNIIVWSFLIIYSLFNIGEGIITVPWLELFSRTIQNERRGKLFGYQLFYSGICGVAGGFIIKIILENPSFSNQFKYSILFGIAGVITTASATMMFPVKDIPKEANKEKINLLHYFGQIPGYMNKNREFIKLSAVQWAGGVSGAAVPFLILFSKDIFKLDASQVSNLIYLQIIGTLMGGILWGSLSHRLGNKYVIMAAQLSGAAINAVALASFAVQPVFFSYVIVLLSGMYSGSWVGNTSYLIDVVKEEVRPIYLVLNSIVTFPLTFVPFIAGFIADALGFLPVFAIGAAGSILATVLAFFLSPPQEVRVSVEGVGVEVNLKNIDL